MADRLRIGLIGAGRIGRLHASHIAFRLPEAELICISDVFLEAAEKCASTVGVHDTYSDYRKVLERRDVEAVMICSSTDTHAEIIEAAAEAGKHIFCEKPIALEPARINVALEAVEKAGVKLQIGFNRRFDANFSRVRELVAAGKIGKPQILRITSRDPEPPPLEYVKVSGGIFLDMTIHDFDMARFLMGEEVTEIFATGEVLINPGIARYGDVDTALVFLKFQSGAIGSIDNSRKAVYGYDQRVEVFGSEGNVMASNNTPDNVSLLDSAGNHLAKPLYFFMDRYVESYLNEVREFIDAVRNDRKPGVTGIDGKIPVLMGLAAKKSLREGRPVKVEEIG